jgi:hypothetical protein
MEQEIKEKKLVKTELKIVNNTLDIIKKIEDLKRNNQINHEEAEVLDTVKNSAMLKIENFRLASKDSLQMDLESKEEMKELQAKLNKDFWPG